MSPVHVIISGASSVGKSTLVNECLKTFREHKKFKYHRYKHIQAVANGNDLLKYIERQDVNEFSNVQRKRIAEQFSCFEKEKDNNYLSDRSAFDLLAYIHYYFKNERKAESIFQSQEFGQLMDQYRTGLIFIIQPQEELRAQNDNTRIIPTYEDQIGFTECLKLWYDQAHLPYFVIPDLDLTKRVEFIINHIHGSFHWLPPEFPIPLNIPFHLNKTTPHMIYIEILDKQNLKISYKKYETNRLVEKYDASCLNNKFASILFEKNIDNQLLEKILSNGVYINNQQYNFIGYSNSQLRGRSCYLYADSIQEIDRIISDNGDFDKIKNISKRAARIGLLFSSCTPTIHIPSEQVIPIDDIERNGHVFTDGCGIIGRKLAKQIVPYLTDFTKPPANID